MKIARFRYKNRKAYGVVQGDEVVEIRGSIYSRFRMTDTKHPLAEVGLLPPPNPARFGARDSILPIIWRMRPKCWETRTPMFPSTRNRG